MNLLLDSYSDNPIIDILVSWPPTPTAVANIRACCPMLRKPFIEITYAGGKSTQHVFDKTSFIAFWQEAQCVLQNVTDIELTTEFALAPWEYSEEFIKELLLRREQSIAESSAIFDGGMYQLFLDQFGENCKDLPVDTRLKLDKARQQAAVLADEKPKTEEY